LIIPYPLAARSVIGIKYAKKYRLINDSPEEWNDISKLCRKFVEDHYSWGKNRFFGKNLSWGQVNIRCQGSGVRFQGREESRGQVSGFRVGKRAEGRCQVSG